MSGLSISSSDSLQKHIPDESQCQHRALPTTTRQPSFISSFIFHLKLKPHWRAHEKYRFHPCPVGGKRSNEAERRINREERAREERGGGKHTVCPLSRCHPAGRSLTFRPCDKARPRVDGPPAILTLIWRAAVAMSMKH